MNLEEYNKRDRDNDEGKARYAESEASERISEASSLPADPAPGLAPPEGVVAPGTLNSKILMARSTALAYTGVADKETREAENGHQTMPKNRAVRIVVYGPGRGGLEKSSASLGRIGNVDD
jgi:hypothetical protein